MTTPEDDLEKALRQALTAAVSQVEPGADGLERIRTRIGDRKPQPWLLSVIVGVVSWARNWTWHGHWAWHVPWPWSRAMSSLAAIPWPRLRRLAPGESLSPALSPGEVRAGEALPAGEPRTKPGRGPTGRDRVAPGSLLPHGTAAIGWLRPVAVLAGVAVIAIVSLGVQPFRQAIIQASNTVLTGGQPTGGAGGGAGTDGNGTRTDSGSSTAQASTASRGTVSTGRSTGAATVSSAASPVATPTSTCVANVTALIHLGNGSQGGASLMAAGAQATGPVSHTAVPTSSPAPYPSSTPTQSCAGTAPPVAATPTGTPTVSPSGTGSATPTDTATGTGTPTPTDTASGTGTPTPTDTASDTGTPTPTDSSSTGVSGTTAPVPGSAGQTPGATSSQTPAGTTDQTPAGTTNQTPAGSTNQTPAGTTNQAPAAAGGAPSGAATPSPDPDAS